METAGIIVVAAGIIGFGLISQRVQRGIVTPPMVFVLFGLLVGPRALGFIDADLESGWVHLLAELALIMVLFTDAARIDLQLLRREHDLPVCMLLLGLPMTIALGTLVGAWLFDGFNVWEAAVLAAILAPTDAALGQAVVSNPRVPVRIRQALNVESGLNDGIMLPVLLILVAWAGATEPDQTAAHWARFAILQVTLGPLIGLAVGYLCGKVVDRASVSGWMNHTFEQLSALGIALLAFSLAEAAGGNGFIAAFCAGLAVGNFARRLCTRLYEFAEAEGQLLTLLIFLVFGVAMVPIALDHVDTVVVLYALLSLTVVRMIPVALSLLGKRLRGDTIVFLGWFGPRGIASILFALLVVDESMLSSREEIQAIVVAVVLLSVFAHGLTASPAARWYADRLGEPEPGMTEHDTVAEMPLRLGSSVPDS